MKKILLIIIITFTTMGKFILPQMDGGDGTNPLLQGTPLASKTDTRSPAEQRLDTQKALYPGVKSWTGAQTNVAQNNISSTGTIPGNQVTKTVPSKQKTTNVGNEKYSGKKSYVDVLGQSGNFSNQSFDQMMVGADGKPHFHDTPENRKKWEQYYKPETETTGNPEQEIKISEPLNQDVPLDSQLSDDGGNASDTEPKERKMMNELLGSGIPANDVADTTRKSYSQISGGPTTADKLKFRGLPKSPWTLK